MLLFRREKIAVVWVREQQNEQGRQYSKPGFRSARSRRFELVFTDGEDSAYESLVICNILTL